MSRSGLFEVILYRFFASGDECKDHDTCLRMGTDRIYVHGMVSAGRPSPGPPPTPRARPTSTEWGTATDAERVGRRGSGLLSMQAVQIQRLAPLLNAERRPCYGSGRVRLLRLVVLDISLRVRAGAAAAARTRHQNCRNRNMDPSEKDGRNREAPKDGWPDHRKNGRNLNVATKWLNASKNCRH